MGELKRINIPDLESEAKYEEVFLYVELSEAMWAIKLYERTKQEYVKQNNDNAASQDGGSH